MLAMHVKAPEFDGITDWLNVSAPLSLAQLRGKIVVLDFWTFCCVDCMHILPYLKELEHTYPHELVVIGVHSAKFSNEKDSSHIRRAIDRYGIEHAVANDSKFALWESYWVREWPTLVLIDPDGYIVEQIPCSKRPYGKLNAPIETLIEEFSAAGKLNRDPLPVAFGTANDPVLSQLRSEQSAATSQATLLYPGKITTDGMRLYVSDTGHNRVVITSLTGEIIEIIGTGSAGHTDGSFNDAQLRAPQGLALLEDKLYIADTENHLLRCADLRRRTITTIAGTGKQSLLSESPQRSGKALQTDLSSPWDLIWHRDKLYICMAGPHQIWCYDPASESIALYAGCEIESLKDGALKEAQLAQPSGITTDGKSIYFADSETSSIRRITEPGTDDARVETIIGKGLFEFGDIDGDVGKARLQHPLGIVIADEHFYICDSYNHKIKRLNVSSGQISTLSGGPGSGFESGANPKFAEPGGLTYFNGNLYVADTNNHAIRVADVKTGASSTLLITDCRAPEGRSIPPTAQRDSTNGVPTLSTRLLDSKSLPNLRRLTVDTVHDLNAQLPVEITANVELPPHQHLNADAPLLAAIRCAGLANISVKRTQQNQSERNLTFCFSARPASHGIGTAGEPVLLELVLQLYYCGDGEDASACRIATIYWSCPMRIGAFGKSTNVIAFRDSIG